jgi:hypothetical protein
MLAPTPAASVMMVMIVKIGERLSLRNTCLSCSENNSIGTSL